MKTLTLCGALMLGLAALSPASAAELERVSFPSANKDATPLEGYVMRPAGTGPFPAVVALHGCSGLWGRTTGELSKRHTDWGERLVQAGYLVLFPDSFNPRGVTSVCNAANRVVAPAGRAHDAIGAAQWLAAQSFVDKARIGALGWSNGGSTVLHMVARRNASPAFAAAVAFYPGCRVLTERRQWEPRMPLLIQIGEADDWTPAAPCKELAARNKDIRIDVYPEAYHDFDAPDTPLRERRGVAFSATGTGIVHVGTNEPARRAAIDSTMKFFAEQLQTGQRPTR
jgi:dienelactone hydrolase